MRAVDIQADVRVDVESAKDCGWEAVIQIAGIQL